MTSYNDVMIVCSDVSVGNHCTCAEELPLFVCLPASVHTEDTEYYGESKPHPLFSKPFSVPVTLSPRYFSAPSYCRLIY